jgi:hypothetical protein
MSNSLRIIVTGLVGLHPVGGVAWDYLQYVVGLARLGHDVYYHEDTWSWPYHPVEKRSTNDGSYSAAYIGEFFSRYAPELTDRWHYFHLHDRSFGMGRATFDEVARTADIFVNVSGANFFPDELSPHCTKVFLDTDPGYNQIILSEQPAWSENVERWCASVVEHDQHFTYAENICGADCIIPKVGIGWKITRMPVVLDLWQSLALSASPDGSPWTTVMTWNAFKGKLVYRGAEYGSKGKEFERLIDLPRHVDVPLEIAVGGKDAPLARLAEHGWTVVDGPSRTLTPHSYQDFISGSRGEISIAKHVYVAMRSGWFSCRSACYLAAGRPVVVQDTGFAGILPVGLGLLAFSTREEAAQAISAVEREYPLHRKAAIAIAHECFDARPVLTRLLADIGA